MASRVRDDVIISIAIGYFHCFVSSVDDCYSSSCVSEQRNVSGVHALRDDATRGRVSLSALPDFDSLQFFDTLPRRMELLYFLRLRTYNCSVRFD